MNMNKTEVQGWMEVVEQERTLEACLQLAWALGYWVKVDSDGTVWVNVSVYVDSEVLVDDLLRRARAFLVTCGGDGR